METKLELTAGSETFVYEAIRTVFVGERSDDVNVEVVARLRDMTGGTVAAFSQGDDFPAGWDAETFRAPKLGDVELLIHKAKNLHERTPEVSVLRTILETLRAELTSGPSLELSSQAAVGERGAKSPATYYQTRVDLWSQDAVVNGIPYDHTATNTVRYKRVGDGAWQYDTTYTRCNHGSCPGQDRMVKYATCRGPSPSTYYRTPQKCDGWWGVNHLCNNDTLMQIYNAKYNRHHDRADDYEEICDSGFLFHRPWCSDI